MVGGENPSACLRALRTYVVMRNGEEDMAIAHEPPGKATLTETPPSQDAVRAGNVDRVLGLVRRAGVLPALALVIVVGAIASPTFLTISNFRDVLTTAAVVGVLAVGEGLVILA